MKRFLKISIFIVLLIGFFITLGFTVDVNKGRTCDALNISFSTDSPYPLMTTSMVEQLLSSNGIRVRGKRIDELRVDHIERVLREAPHVEHARVYSDISGNLNIQIDQREPVARVFNPDSKSFYLDRFGEPMPLSPNYSARVIGITADFTLPMVHSHENQRMEEVYNQIMSTVHFINASDFWKSQIAHLHVTGNGEIELTPRVGNHKIMLGKASDLEVKFDNLWNFYRSCEEHQAWNKYKTLNLKYSNQIVCTKK